MLPQPLAQVRSSEGNLESQETKHSALEKLQPENITGTRTCQL